MANKTITILGITFKYRLIDFNQHSVGKNIQINNDNFKLFADFLSQFASKVTGISDSSSTVKNIFEIDLSNLNTNDKIGSELEINEDLTIKMLDINQYLLSFNNFKTLDNSIIQFNDVSNNNQNLIKLDYNYSLLFDATENKFNKMLLDFNTDDTTKIKMIII